jgi:hypothetical protein
MTIHEHLVDVLCRNAGLDMTAARAVERALATGRRQHSMSSRALAEVRRCHPFRDEQMYARLKAMSCPVEVKRQGWIARVVAKVRGWR